MGMIACFLFQRVLRVMESVRTLSKSVGGAEKVVLSWGSYLFSTPQSVGPCFLSLGICVVSPSVDRKPRNLKSLPPAAEIEFLCSMWTSGLLWFVGSVSLANDLL